MSPPQATFISALAGIVVFGLGSAAVSQVVEEEVPPVPPPGATPVPPQTAPLTDKKLDQYADAFLGIEQIEAEASEQLDKAEDQAAAVAIKEKAEGAIIEAIERSGLKLDEFNQITEVAALDEDVRRRIADRVRKRRII